LRQEFKRLTHLETWKDGDSGELVDFFLLSRVCNLLPYKAVQVSFETDSSLALRLTLTSGQ